MSRELYLVIETSAVGDEVIGTFSTMAQARAALPEDNVARMIENFRIEMHILDEPRQEEGWRVAISRDGSEISVSRLILCNCEADEETISRGSYIEDGGERMHLIIWARSKGSALLAAEKHRQSLLDRGVWGFEFLPLAPVVAQEW